MITNQSGFFSGELELGVEGVTQVSQQERRGSADRPKPRTSLTQLLLCRGSKRFASLSEPQIEADMQPPPQLRPEPPRRPCECNPPICASRPRVSCVRLARRTHPTPSVRHPARPAVCAATRLQVLHVPLYGTMEYYAAFPMAVVFSPNAGRKAVLYFLKHPRAEELLHGGEQSVLGERVHRRLFGGR